MVVFVEEVRGYDSERPQVPLGAGDVLRVDQVVVKKYVHFGIVNQVYVYDQEPEREGALLTSVELWSPKGRTYPLLFNLSVFL